MTNNSGYFRQTIYYPYSWALQIAQGSVLNLLVQSPTYPTPQLGDIPYIDAAATLNSSNRSTSLFILNRDLVNSRKVDINWQETPPSRMTFAKVLTGSDVKAFNSFASPLRVQPALLDKPVTRSSTTTFEMPPRAYAAIQWQA